MGAFAQRSNGTELLVNSFPYMTMAVCSNEVYVLDSTVGQKSSPMAVKTIVACMYTIYT